MLELQKFLIQHDIEKLKEWYGVYAKQHPKFPNLYQFTYDQIESSSFRFNPIVRESRGIILDRDDNWKVIARPFDRFFNYGEYPDGEEQFDWSSVVAQEKVDGSLMILYNYAGAWHVATKGSPDAGGNVGQESFTFADLFWKTFNNQFVPSFFDRISTSTYTYIFELTSKYIS